MFGSDEQGHQACGNAGKDISCLNHKSFLLGWVLVLNIMAEPRPWMATPKRLNADRVALIKDC